MSEPTENSLEEEMRALRAENARLRAQVARQQAEAERREHTDRPQHEPSQANFHQALGDLSRSNAWERGGLEASLEEILRVAANVLRVERAGVWLFDENHSRITCRFLFETDPARRSVGLELDRASYPTYFLALEENRTISALDAVQDARTKEFANTYLAQFGIVSLVDAPIRLFGRLVGVVCHESTGQRREWSPEEEAFAGSIADFVALTMEAQDRREAIQAQGRLVAILEATSDIVCIVGMDGKALYLNQAGYRFFGLSPEDDISEKHIRDGHPPQSADYLEQVAIPKAIRDGLWEGETLVWNAEEREAPVSQVLIAHRNAQGEVERLSTIMRDLSERKLLEEELRQAQKLESIGRLAGGVAHDFNNLLTAILGYAMLAQQSVPPDSDVKTYLDNVQRTGERAVNLTGQLLAFARKQVITPRIVSLNDILADMKELLQRVIGPAVSIVFRTAPDLWAMKVDPGQFEQVLLNLAVNARDAMPQGGTLTLETHNITLGATEARQHSGMTPGDYVQLIVRDTGIGMDETVQAHVFEPFFTTKERGKGTGLGLATSHGIIRQSGGQIWLTSAPGKGTDFTICLPRAQETLPVSVSSPRRADVPQGTETILLIEPDALVRELSSRSLQLYGYTVLEVENENEALSLLESHPASISLMVADKSLITTRNIGLIERFWQAVPSLKILFLADSVEDARANFGVRGADIALLPKPFTPGSLASKVRELLDAPNPG